MYNRGWLSKLKVCFQSEENYIIKHIYNVFFFFFLMWWERLMTSWLSKINGTPDCIFKLISINVKGMIFMEERLEENSLECYLSLICRGSR